MGRRKEISVEQWPDFDVLAVKSGCITVKQQTIWRNRYQENDVLGENYQLEIATFYTRNEVSRFNFCLASIPNNPHDYFSLQKKKKNTRCIAKRTPPFTARFPWSEMKRFLRTLIYSALCRILLSRLPGNVRLLFLQWRIVFFKFAVKRVENYYERFLFLQN